MDSPNPNELGIQLGARALRVRRDGVQAYEVPWVSCTAFREAVAEQQGGRCRQCGFLAEVHTPQEEVAS